MQNKNKRIKDFFKLDVSNDKLQLFEELEEFLDSGVQTFVLTGYAGTGKTTVMKALGDYLSYKKRHFKMMASTGRAAKILRDKTKYDASTIHLGIYRFELSKNKDGYIHLVFKVVINFENKDKVYIIDEASMISNRPANPSYATFGSGKLLDDIYTYLGGRKVIFIGDLGQLPPVNSDISPALNPIYLQKHYQTKVQNFNLSVIHRRDHKSALYKLSKHFLDIFDTGTYNKKLDIDVDRTAGDIRFISYEYDLINKYCSGYTENVQPDSIILTLSNKKVHSLNLYVRNELYSDFSHLHKNEWFINYSNNYKFNILNGDNIKLIELTGEPEHRAGLTFQPALWEFEYMNKKIQIKAFVILEYLISNIPALNIEAEKNLVIDFNIRMHKKEIKPSNKIEYMQALKTDPYLNALRLRYGHALTVHKAQGGEWNKVFLVFENYFGNYFKPKYQHNWAYTAFTRARKVLFIQNNPYIK